MSNVKTSTTTDINDNNIQKRRKNNDEQQESCFGESTTTTTTTTTKRRTRLSCWMSLVILVLMVIGSLFSMMGIITTQFESDNNGRLEIKIAISTTTATTTGGVVKDEEEEAGEDVFLTNNNKNSSTVDDVVVHHRSSDTAGEREPIKSSLSQEDGDDDDDTTTTSTTTKIPYLGQIDLDLQPWRNQEEENIGGIITLEMLNQAENATQALSLRFHVRNNQFYISSTNNDETHLQNMWMALTYRWQGMLADLAYSGGCNGKPLPDLDAVLAIGDGTPIVHVVTTTNTTDLDDNNNNNTTTTTIPAPLFGFQKKRQDAGILIPYVSYWATDPEYFQHQTDTQSSSPSYSNWTTKKDILFWRGSTTGGTYSIQNWKEKQRSKAVLACLRDPVLKPLCNVKFYNFAQMGNDTKYTMLQELGKDGFGKKMGLVEHMQFKYLLSMDGNGPCSGRFEKFLSGTSAIFKTDSDHVEFYYNFLEPMKQYIPIKEDLSNLRDQLLWAIHHPTQIQQMVHNMRIFSQSIHQRPKSIYIKQLLTEYAKLLNYDLVPIEELQRDRIVRPIYPRAKPNSQALIDFDRNCTNPIYACDEAKETDDSFLVSHYAIMGRPGKSTAEMCTSPQRDF